MRISKNHNSLGCEQPLRPIDVKQSPNALRTHTVYIQYMYMYMHVYMYMYMYTVYMYIHNVHSYIYMYMYMYIVHVCVTCGRVPNDVNV